MILILILAAQMIVPKPAWSDRSGYFPKGMYSAQYPVIGEWRCPQKYKLAFPDGKPVHISDVWNRDEKNLVCKKVEDQKLKRTGAYDGKRIGSNGRLDSTPRAAQRNDRGSQGWL